MYCAGKLPLVLSRKGKDALGLRIDYLDVHSAELARGERFEFGENWSRFLRVLNEDRIRQAEQSLAAMLEAQDLHGKTFLDMGSGSGLFSLAAKRLGAKVVSFDCDPSSVACTAELRRRYFVGDPDWTVIRGSALDRDFVASLRLFDVVYSWGVLASYRRDVEGFGKRRNRRCPGREAVYRDL